MLIAYSYSLIYCFCVADALILFAAYYYVMQPILVITSAMFEKYKCSIFLR